MKKSLLIITFLCAPLALAMDMRDGKASNPAPSTPKRQVNPQEEKELANKQEEQLRQQDEAILLMTPHQLANHAAKENHRRRIGLAVKSAAQPSDGKGSRPAQSTGNQNTASTIPNSSDSNKSTPHAPMPPLPSPESVHHLQSQYPPVFTWGKKEFTKAAAEEYSHAFNTGVESEHPDALLVSQETPEQQARREIRAQRELKEMEQQFEASDDNEPRVPELTVEISKSEQQHEQLHSLPLPSSSSSALSEDSKSGLRFSQIKKELLSSSPSNQFTPSVATSKSAPEISQIHSSKRSDDDADDDDDTAPEISQRLNERAEVAKVEGIKPSELRRVEPDAIRGEDCAAPLSPSKSVSSGRITAEPTPASSKNGSARNSDTASSSPLISESNSPHYSQDEFLPLSSREASNQPSPAVMPAEKKIGENELGTTAVPQVSMVMRQVANEKEEKKGDEPISFAVTPIANEQQNSGAISQSVSQPVPSISHEWDDQSPYDEEAQRIARPRLDAINKALLQRVLRRDSTESDDGKTNYAAAVEANHNATQVNAQPAEAAPVGYHKGNAPAALKKIERIAQSNSNISSAVQSIQTQPELVTPHFPPFDTRTGSPSNLAAALVAVNEGIHQENEGEKTARRLNEERSRRADARLEAAEAGRAQPGARERTLERQRKNAVGKDADLDGLGSLFPEPEDKKPDNRQTSGRSKLPLYTLLCATSAGAFMVGADFAGYDLIAYDIAGMLVRLKYRVLLALDWMDIEQIKAAIAEREQILKQADLKDKKRASLVLDLEFLEGALEKLTKREKIK